jgi:hypothetical protein
MKSSKLTFICVLLSVIAALAIAQKPVQPKTEFKNPPKTARPWVYWFWLNSNITKEGITADLEAMKRVGIGGVLIMEVEQGAPLGKVGFASKEWNEMFQFVCKEANRLGLEVNMNDDAGWNGSGGPWITPEVAMKRVVWSDTDVEGPSEYTNKLSQPRTVEGYYKDIRVVAFPMVSDYRIKDIEGKSAADRQDGLPSPAKATEAPRVAIIDLSQAVDLTDKMSPDGSITWTVPEGKWTIMRIGYTLTGSRNGPAPASGTGLEPDKLSKAGADAAFNGFINKLVSENRDLVGKSFVATHIDSWENGSQNWTKTFADDFKRLRGYDPLPYLPVFSGRVVTSAEVSERFLWDVRKTVSDLVIANYADRMRILASQKGLRLTIEAYGNCTMEDIAYGGRADEPMAEFWSWPNKMADYSVYEMASAAHLYGKPILGAEAFTAIDTEKWLGHPGNIKALGDWAFCHGINRFVFHRYAMQPFLNVAPGMAMGPWGLHYERTNTWWDQSLAWHQYLARCQYLLQKGLPVVDVLYLAPEGAPSSFFSPQDTLYKSDACPSEVILKRLSVKNGKLVLPNGMSYRVLVLPSDGVMTPEVIKKIKELVDQGAKVVGPLPTQSPSLTNHPDCDTEVAKIAGELAKSPKRLNAKTPEEALKYMGIAPDFTSNRGYDYIHKSLDGAEIYFVSNPRNRVARASCSFRIVGKQPERWNPETGQSSDIVSFTSTRKGTNLELVLGPAESTFIVFRKPAGTPIQITDLNDKTIKDIPVPQIVRATWGPKGDASKTKDVKVLVQKIADSGRDSFLVAELAKDGDPAFGVVKTLNLEYKVGNKVVKASAIDQETIDFELPNNRVPGATILSLPNGTRYVKVDRPGTYKIGDRVRPILPWKNEVAINGPWTLKFPGTTPKTVKLATLKSWSDLTDETMKYFSGTATYVKEFTLPFDKTSDLILELELNKVEVMAEVIVNGKNLGVLWHTPYKVDVTKALKQGKNRLEIRVTNLWINRQIGDEFLPEDSDRNDNGTLKSWPEWVLNGKTSPTGRQSFTSWRLWHKNDKLVPSGMLGPVKILVAKTVPVAPAKSK